MPDLGGRDVQLGPQFPHGSNILKKSRDPSCTRDKAKAEVLARVTSEYLNWRDKAEAAGFAPDQAAAFVARQTDLYNDYRDVLDDPSVDVFDSRGALQPSALEEFCTYLFRPLLDAIQADIAIGHHSVYQRLYFTAPNFRAFSAMPQPRYPVGNLDFVIGKAVDSTLTTEADEHSQRIYIPAVAVECKTYLDRPRYIESDILATNIKRGFPRCLYIVISEFLKLDLDKVDVYGSPIDRIYVFRREQNVDRSIRRAQGKGLTPLYTPAVYDFFTAVRQHLEEDWAAPEDWEDSGILK